MRNKDTWLSALKKFGYDNITIELILIRPPEMTIALEFYGYRLYESRLEESRKITRGRKVLKNSLKSFVT